MTLDPAMDRIKHLSIKLINEDREEEVVEDGAEDGDTEDKLDEDDKDGVSANLILKSRAFFEQ